MCPESTSEVRPSSPSGWVGSWIRAMSTGSSGCSSSYAVMVSPSWKPLAETASLPACQPPAGKEDRKSTRLNSSHVAISYAVFCLKKKTYIQDGLLSCASRLDNGTYGLLIPNLHQRAADERT